MKRPLAVLVSAAAASTSTRSSLGLKLIFAIIINCDLVKQICSSASAIIVPLWIFRQFMQIFAGTGCKYQEKCQTDRVDFKRNWQFDRVFDMDLNHLMITNMNSRRDFLTKALALGAVAGIPVSTFGKEEEQNQASLPSLKGRKVLFTYGGWDGHEPQKYVDFFTPWLKSEGAEVQTSNTLDPYADKALMDTIDLVLQIVTMSTITKEQEAGLLAAIEKNGTGMAGWHGGMCDSFRQNEAYRYMTGGSWVSH